MHHNGNVRGHICHHTGTHTSNLPKPEFPTYGQWTACRICMASRRCAHLAFDKTQRQTDYARIPHLLSYHINRFLSHRISCNTHSQQLSKPNISAYSHSMHHLAMGCHTPHTQT